MNDRLQNHNFVRSAITGAGNQFDMELFARSATEDRNNYIPPGRHVVQVEKVTMYPDHIQVALGRGWDAFRNGQEARGGQISEPKPPEPKAPTPVPQAQYGLGQRRIK